MKDKLQLKWEADIAKHLVGRTIARIEYLSQEEADQYGWHKRPLCIKLVDKKGQGIWIVPMMDDEGNDGGAISTNIEGLETIPVL